MSLNHDISIFNKKNTRKCKKSKPPKDSNEHRSWEQWSSEAEMIFFECLSRKSRDWNAIALEIGNKSSEQVCIYSEDFEQCTF